MELEDFVEKMHQQDKRFIGIVKCIPKQCYKQQSKKQYFNEDPSSTCKETSLQKKNSKQFKVKERINAASRKKKERENLHEQTKKEPYYESTVQKMNK